MVNVLLILLNIMLYTLQTLLFKMFADRYPGKPHNTTFVYLSLAGVVCALVSFAVGGFRFEFNPLTLLLGVLNSVTFFLYYIFLFYASGEGPYSIVMTFSTAGAITIPVFVSLFAFGDVPTVWKVLVLLVILVSAYFVSKKPDEKGEIKNKKKFFLFSFGVALVNGMFCGLINLQQAYTGAGQKEEMLIYTFLLASVFSLSYLFIKGGRSAASDFRQTKGSLAFMLFASLSAAFAVNLLYPLR